MWREILRIINEATVDGLSQGKVPVHEDDFLSALRHSNEVFAAMKTHQMGEDMAKKLLDGNGKLKPFERWRDDVSSIARHHVGPWLKTEYNTAVIRAHAAADWREFEYNKDILPNLRWMPTTSAEPDSAHKAYWQMKLTLPVDDPFWDEHHPGDRWNCKCSLEATDDPEVRPVELKYTKPQRGLESNPGKTAEMFSNTHPYYPNSCNSCPFNKGFKNKAKSFFRNEKKHCNDCSKINGVIRNSNQDNIIIQAKSNIKKLFDDIKTYGHPTDASPILLGNFPKDIIQKIKENGIELSSTAIYTSPKRLLHHRGGQKAERDKEVSFDDFIELPEKMPFMDIYTEGKALIFTDYINKFVINPNDKIKVRKDKIIANNHISSSKVKDKMEFRNGYKKIK